MERALSRTSTSYLTVAESDEARDPAAFLDHHAERLPEMQKGAKHAATHPPGPVLFYRGLIGLFEAAPAAADALLTAGGIDPDAGRRPAPVRAAALAGPLLITFLCAAAAWPVAALARAGGLDAPRAARLAALWPLLPGPALMAPHFDQMLALPVTAAAALLASAVVVGARTARSLEPSPPASAPASRCRSRTARRPLSSSPAPPRSPSPDASIRHARCRPRSRGPPARCALRHPPAHGLGTRADRRRADGPRHSSRGVHAAALVRDVAALQSPRPGDFRRDPGDRRRPHAAGAAGGRARSLRSHAGGPRRGPRAAPAVGDGARRDRAHRDPPDAGAARGVARPAGRSLPSIRGPPRPRPRWPPSCSPR